MRPGRIVPIPHEVMPASDSDSKSGRSSSGSRSRSRSRSSSSSRSRDRTKRRDDSKSRDNHDSSKNGTATLHISNLTRNVNKVVVDSIVFDTHLAVAAAPNILIFTFPCFQEHLFEIFESYGKVKDVDMGMDPKVNTKQ